MRDSLKVVREKGFEPPRANAHQVLNLARLPFRHSRKNGEPSRARTWDTLIKSLSKGILAE